MKICIEGLPGAGKTSLLNLLKNHFDALFLEEITLSEKGDRDNIYYLKNDLLKNKLAKKALTPLVFSDRSYFSTLAYNYAASYIEPENTYKTIKAIISKYLNAKRLTAPDICLFLDIDVKIAFNRQRKENYTKLWHNKQFLSHLYKFYAKNISKTFPLVYKIDASRSLDTVVSEVKKIILKEIRNNFIWPILFDLDGTLINTKSLAIKSYRNAARMLNYRVPSSKKIVSCQGIPVTKVVKNLFPGVSEEQFSGHLINFEIKHYLKYVTIYEDIENVLRILNKMNIPVGIVTSRGPVTTDLYFELIKEKGAIRTIVRYGDTNESKPHSEPVLHALKKLKSNGDGLMVGDSSYDIISAKGAGIKSAAACWGYNSRMKLSKYEPDFVLTKPNDILKIIEK